MELLITISIIAVLSAISLFAVSGARKSARDGRRKADLESIRSALELYKADCGSYKLTLPGVGSALTSDAPPTCPTGGIVYLQKMPGDPVGSSQTYRYNRPAASPNIYYLCARLEEPPATAMDVTNCNGNCGSAGACNYIVFNP